MNRYRPGMHGLLDLYHCDAALLGDAATLESLLQQAADAAGATTLARYFHPFGTGMGVTGVLLLAESHISVHTWPEQRFAAFDIFFCGDKPLAPLKAMLAEALHAGEAHWQEITRGNNILRK